MLEGTGTPILCMLAVDNLEGPFDTAHRKKGGKGDNEEEKVSRKLRGREIEGAHALRGNHVPATPDYPSYR